MNTIRFILLLIFCLCSIFTHSRSFANNPNKTYYVKYILDSRGNAIKDETTMRVTPNRIYVSRNGQEKYWDCTYKGIKYDEPTKGKKVGYHTYYLTNKNVSIIISDYKVVKHEGTFYYLINIDGQTQLAL